MQPWSLIVVDRSNRERGAACAKAFLDVVETVYFYDGSRIYDSRSNVAQEPPISVDLLLMHNGEGGEGERSLVQKLIADHRLSVRLPLIRYTGGTPSAAAGDDGWMIQRIVGSASDAPSVQEARELCAWLARTAGRAGADTEALPSLLAASQGAENVGALMVLMQGYLCVAAASGECEANEPNAALLREPLKRTGWTDMDPTLRSGLAGRISERFQEVTMARWWLTPFGLWDVERGVPLADEARWAEFERAVAAEMRWLGHSEDLGKVVAFLTLLRVDSPVRPSRAIADACSAVLRGSSKE